MKHEPCYIELNPDFLYELEGNHKHIKLVIISRCPVSRAAVVRKNSCRARTPSNCSEQVPGPYP